MLFLREPPDAAARRHLNLTQAIDLYQQAIARDANFGRAYAGLAGLTCCSRVMQAARESSARAGAGCGGAGRITGAADGHTLGVRAFVHFRSREWQAAHDDFDRAIAAGPNDPMCCSGTAVPREHRLIERAERAARDAVTADPLSPVAISARRGQPVDQRPEAADDHLRSRRKWVFKDPDYGSVDRVPAQRRTAERCAQGADRDAAQPWTIHRWIDPVFAAMTGNGSKQAALDALNRTYASGELGVPMYVGALFFVGDIDGLYVAMERVVASGEPFDVEVFFSRMGRPFRKDPRHAADDRLGLIDFWDRAGWPTCAPAKARVSCAVNREVAATSYPRPVSLGTVGTVAVELVARAEERRSRCRAVRVPLRRIGRTLRRGSGRCRLRRNVHAAATRNRADGARVEAGTGVGGTWYWNRYPGARVDVEASVLVSVRGSAQRWQWSSATRRGELLRYTVTSPSARLEARHPAEHARAVVALRRCDGSMGSSPTAPRALLHPRIGCLSSTGVPDFKVCAISKAAGTTPAAGRTTASTSPASVAVIGFRLFRRSIDTMIAQQAKTAVRVPAHRDVFGAGAQRPVDPQALAQVKANYREFRERNARPATVSFSMQTKHRRCR
jgi:hypothetical protein